MNFNIFQIFLPTQGKDVEWLQTLQQRVDEKFKFFENIHQNMREFNKILKTFADKLEYQSKVFDSISHTLEDQCIYDAYKLIHVKIVDSIKAENEYAENNLKMLELHINKYRGEMAIYSDLRNIKKNMQTERAELKNNKTKYHEAGIDMEKKIKKFVEDNFSIMNNLPNNLKNQLTGFAKNPKKLLKKYKDSVQRVNDLSVIFNNKQDELFNLLPFFGKQDNEFFSKISTYFINTIQKDSEFLDLTKKNMNIIQQNEKKNDLNNLIKECQDNKNEEQKVELLQYQSGLEFSKCKDKDEFDRVAKTVDTINMTMEDNIFPNFDYEVDLKTFKEAKLIRKLFEMKEVDENSENELLDSLDDKINHKAMFIVLSQLRTNSTFHRPKSFIEAFGKAFNKMINMANKDEINDCVKNCIILSQTYFYDDENEKNKKIYLFELIKTNKILNNSHYWREFIDCMIKLEFDRFKKHHSYPDYDIEKCENIPNKVKNKFDEIVFSQLLSFLTTLNDFEMDKRVILKIADEFVQKYSYLSESNIQGIYQTISKDKEEIEKLRKEYNVSLESEKIEIKGIEKLKQEKKEEPKEDKKEESREESKEEKKEESKEENKEETKEDKKEETKEEKKEEPKEDKKEEPKEELKKEEEKVEKNEIKANDGN